MIQKVILVLAGLVLLTSATLDCATHPLRNYSLFNWSIENKGLTCFTKGKENGGCFTTTMTPMSDYFVSGSAPVTGADATAVCSDLKNSCIDPAKIEEYRNTLTGYIDTYTVSFKEIFDYKVTEDTELAALLQKYANEINGFVNDINLGPLNGIKSTVTDEVDKLPEKAMDVIEDLFEKLKNVAIPLIDKLDPLFADISTYIAGMTCVIADADLDEHVEEGVLKLKNNIWDLLTDKLDDLERGQLGMFFEDLQEDVKKFYNNLMAKIDAFIPEKILGFNVSDALPNGVSGVINDALAPDTPVALIEKYIDVEKIFTNITTEFQNCLFPSSPDGYCVPFLDQIIWFIDCIKILASGDFNGFVDALKGGFDRDTMIANQSATLLAMREQMLGGVRVLAVASVSSGDDGVDIVARSSSSSVKVYDENNKEGDDGKENIMILGKEVPMEYVFAAAGGLGVLILLVISCCCCLCKKSPQMGYGAPGMNFQQGPPMSMQRGMMGPPSMGQRNMGPPSMMGRPF